GGGGGDGALQGFPRSVGGRLFRRDTCGLSESVVRPHACSCVCVCLCVLFFLQPCPARRAAKALVKVKDAFLRACLPALASPSSSIQHTMSPGCARPRRRSEKCRPILCRRSTEKMLCVQRSDGWSFALQLRRLDGMFARIVQRPTTQQVHLSRASVIKCPRFVS
ncbi:unnamed protein product, partial [Scytosiphon promiscuus]